MKYDFICRRYFQLLITLFSYDEYMYRYYYSRSNLFNRSFTIISFLIDSILYKIKRGVINNFTLSTSSNLLGFLNKSTNRLRVGFFISNFIHSVKNHNHNKSELLTVHLRATLHNVFIYVLFRNTIIYKKSCGELNNVIKKGRRFFRNVFSLGENAKEGLLNLQKSMFIVNVRIIINGQWSLLSPIFKVFSFSPNHKVKLKRRKYDRIDKRYLIFDLRTLYKQFYKILYFMVKVFKSRFTIVPHIKRNNKYFSLANEVLERTYYHKILYDSFYNSRFIMVDFFRDKTSWPFNGCRSKNRLC